MFITPPIICDDISIGAWLPLCMMMRFAALDRSEAESMIKSLKSYKIIQGVRGQEGVNEEKFIDIITRLSALVTVAPEIIELDLNPLLGKADSVVAVDARINIVKNK